MKQVKKNIPRLRFPGFIDDWEQHKVTELGEIYIGLVTTMTSHYTDQGALLIRNSDIKDGRFEFGDNPIYLDDEFAKQNASRKHKVGDVITVHTGDIGTSSVITEKEAGSIGFATIVTRPNKDKITSDYLCAYLNTDTHKNFAMNISTGDGRNNYNLKDYYECVVPVPSIDEQKKISSFIDGLNNLIILHQRKLDQIKEYRNGMLQKMFPKEGETVPEVRFAGYTDDWEQRKLGESLSFLKDGTHGTHADSIEGPLLLSAKNIKGGNIIWDDSDRRISQEEYNKIHSNFSLKAGDVLLTIVGSIGETAILRDSTGLTFQRSVAFLRPCDKVLSEFLHTAIQTPAFQKELESRKSTSAQPGIYLGDLAEMPFSFPTQIEEQGQIGGFFEMLDETITLHQRKIEAMKEYKKGLLQQMFV